jgi:hypothetical protein
VDPYTWLTDPDPDSALFVSDFQDAKKKMSFFPNLFCLLLSVGTFTSVFKDKKIIKKSLNSRNQGFLLTFFAC